MSSQMQPVQCIHGGSSNCVMCLLKQSSLTLPIVIQHLHLLGAFAQDTLWLCLDNGLRLLHPFMPFVTEELWQRLPPARDCMRKESIMISKYPSLIECWTNENVEYEMDMVESAVKSLRSLRSLMPAKERHERRAAFALCRNEAVAEIIKSRELEILTLATLSSLKVLSENDAAPAGCAVSVVNEAISVYLKLRGTLNAEVEREKLKKKMEDIQKQRDSLTGMMNASGYQEKVPLHIHEENIAKLSTLMQELLSFEQASQHLEREIAAEALSTFMDSQSHLVPSSENPVENSTENLPQSLDSYYKNPRETIAPYEQYPSQTIDSRGQSQSGTLGSYEEHQSERNLCSYDQNPRENPGSNYQNQDSMSKPLGLDENSGQSNYQKQETSNLENGHLRTADKASDGTQIDTPSKPEIHKSLLSGNGLTNTHSGTDKDYSGGEEETTSRRRRRSRWDPPPTESNEGGGSDGGSAGKRKRKSRWADDEPKPVIQLPDFMKDFTGGIEFDPEIQALNSRLLEISRKLHSGLPLDDRPEGARSPSPEPDI
ncbi:hypothetical protein F0562_031404 [Nyssa sinensis]|uniref:valine--tRNA ligase n=1 Tax=Nyssa sinensis TaxID=561372 RepID=A0A5J5AWL2_9ASTE|nr:hypothetical protein F0562_031404 [Nyssa sinensis]